MHVHFDNLKKYTKFVIPVPHPPPLFYCLEKLFNMKNSCTLFILTWTCFVTDAQNVFISSYKQPNEPSITMDLENSNYLVAGANGDNYYTSQDTGRTWTQKVLTSSLGVWGDPALITDTAGNFYYFHLGSNKIVCQKSTNKGQNWNEGSYTGLSASKLQDKEWPAVDRKNNILYVTWTQFDDYGNSNPMDSSIILFSKSLDEGLTWSAAKRINKIAGDCLDMDYTVEGAVPAVGVNGEIYVSWASGQGIMFNKSTDEGVTWMPQEKMIAANPGGWDYKIPGLLRCNGLPITLCDLSNGPNRGTIYVNWSDQRNGTTDTDIWLSKSSDGGTTWSAPVRVNDDNTNRHQFFTWMAIDQTNGHLYVVFYDRRNYTDNRTDVYLARSIDGGINFENKRISESPFTPIANVFFGDYTNVVAHNGIVRPIWVRQENAVSSIWTDISPVEKIFTGIQEDFSFEQAFFENAPNPAKDRVYVSFKLNTASWINLAVYNMQGKLLKQCIHDENRSMGKYVEQVDLNTIAPDPGVYLLVLEINGMKKAIKQVKMD